MVSSFMAHLFLILSDFRGLSFCDPCFFLRLTFSYGAVFLLLATIESKCIFRQRMEFWNVRMMKKLR